MSGKVISGDYPEHLNPFDENYDPVASAPVAPPRANSSRHQQKYNTWTSNRLHQVVAKQQKPTFLEKPWAALNISPKGKLVRRLSVLKTAVERFATKKKKKYTGSYRESSLPPRSNSLHDEFNYRIISPKVKEKIRQQVFSRSLSAPEQEETESRGKDIPSPPLNGRLTLDLKLDSETHIKVDDCSPTSPESEKDSSQLGARPKTRKKRPPPPPPVEPTQQIIIDTNGQEGSDDSLSANSSITHELEKDAATEDDNSLVELDQQSNKPGDKNR